jgi:hypothetical protein
MEKGTALIMIYAISYDLKQPGRNYDDLYDAIKSANGWAHAMDSLWFISTSESVNAWSDKLLAVMDKNDYLFVVDITGQPRQGWMRQDIWDWLKETERVTVTH